MPSMPPPWPPRLDEVRYEGRGGFYSVGVRSPQRTNTVRWDPGLRQQGRRFAPTFYGTTEVVP